VLPERPDPLVGTILGKVYRVLQPIGAGGMAVVYLVEHQTLLKQFAAKVLSNDLASSLEARARFTQEAHAASQLDHENIVSITDFGVTSDHRPFFVMELLRGQTLDQRLVEGPMTIEEVVAVGVPVARALAHAHAEGIVHLDVKPENIFLVQRSQGRWGVKVVDFGIAKTPQNPRVAKAGETVGSPMFMAPEMCRGADEVDQRADVYSFGILLYLMMCGRLPFDDESMARVLQMQLVELPRPPREVNAQLSPELAAVVECALAKHPDDRYPSMDALLRDLDAALPIGADRLLIEAQSGAALGQTPFSGAMSIGGAASIGRHESYRMPRVTPSVTPSVMTPSVPSSAERPSHPPSPRRRSIAILLPTMIVVIAAFCVTAWRQTTSATARGLHGSAAVPTGVPPTNVAPAEPRAPVTAEPAGAPAAAELPHAVASAEPIDEAPSDDRAASTDAPAAAPATPDGAELKPDRASVKKLSVRPKPGRRPVKRSAAIAALPVGAPPTSPPTAASAAAVEPLPATGAPAANAPDPSHAAHVEAAAEHDAAPVSAAPSPPALPSPPAQPVITAAPAVPVAGAAAPTLAPASPGALDAVPAITALDVKGPLSPSIVRRSVDRTLSQLRACYRASARARGATPELDLQLAFEIDENGLATRVTASGAAFGSLAGCAARVAGQIRTQEAPDVGTAHVTVGIRFRPS